MVNPHRQQNQAINQGIAFRRKKCLHSGISEEEIVDLYHASNVAVIPSLYEGFGFGAGEAMSCGVPLISTHSGGLKRICWRFALKIQPGSTVDIERAVLQLFQNPAHRRDLSEKGRKRIEEHFDWKIAAQSYLDVFNKVIKSFNNEHNQIQKS